jgi:hypothetical protein
MQIIYCEYTDTFCGEANHSWVRRAQIWVPELTHYGYSGSSDGTYKKACKSQLRQIMHKGKAALGLTNVRGSTDAQGDVITFRPYRSCTVAFFTFH